MKWSLRGAAAGSWWDAGQSTPAAGDASAVGALRVFPQQISEFCSGWESAANL